MEEIIKDETEKLTFEDQQRLFPQCMIFIRLSYSEALVTAKEKAKVS